MGAGVRAGAGTGGTGSGRRGDDGGRHVGVRNGVATRNGGVSNGKELRNGGFSNGAGTRNSGFSNGGKVRNGDMLRNGGVRPEGVRNGGYRNGGAGPGSAPDGVSFAFPSSVSSSRKPSPRLWRSLSPSASDSPPSRLGWSAGPGGASRRSPVERAAADELRERLLAELEQKEALTRELEDSRREADEYQAEHEEVAAELDSLRTACRSAEQKVAELELALSERLREIEGKGVRLDEAEENERKAGADRDRMSKELHDLKELHEAFRLKSFERARASSERASLRTAIWRWRAVTRKRTPTPVLRRPRVRCLRHWALLARRRRVLRKMLRRRATGDLRQGWSKWR
ncbi:unnamed protein product, partial [Laminaria digitata]